MSDTRQQAWVYLNTNVFQHLVHLKYLRLYPDEVTCAYAEQGDSAGVLIKHPTELTSWDRLAYGQTANVFLPTASDEASATLRAERVARRVKPEQPVVLKFCDAETQAVFARAFRLRFVKALLSYTTDRIAPEWNADGVVVSQACDDECMEHALTNGYSEGEVRRFFAEDALSFTIREAGKAVCTCFSYLNFGTIWEIGAVYTAERYRRRGLGRRVVGAALKMLLERGGVPRYQVEETNAASLKLAEALGLRQRPRFEHYLASRER